MKKIVLLLFSTFFATALIGQEAGNINYQNQVRFSDNNINIGFQSYTEHFVSVKGMANVPADSHVAIFSVHQVGKTTEEVNTLIDERINNALKEFDKEAFEVFVDMISFVPVYEFEKEKKVFSKKTYSEIPAGFELKKNIHIKYTDSNLLNSVITSLSKHEIYDLVRVDYFANDIEAIKKEMRQKAQSIIKEKIDNYETIVSIEVDSLDKQMTEGYKVMLPVEMYKSYQAYNSTSLNLKKSANVNQIDKTTTLYYQPIIDKEFDFVINPTIFKPVIQIMYEVKVRINLAKPVQPTHTVQKEYILVTPNGEMKTIKVD